MSVRQYVGARYVPKFFENPNGSAEWVKEVSYESLTIVTYLGNSYISKKPVPIGIDITNKEYWVLSGNYNQQIENYRNETIKVSKLLTEKTTYYTPEMYGAKGDGVSDDSDAIQTCFDNIKNNKGAVLMTGTYFIAKPVIITGWGIKIIGNGNIIYNGNDYAVKIHNCTYSTICFGTILSNGGGGILIYNTSSSDYNQYINFYINKITALTNCYKSESVNGSWNNEIRIYNTHCGTFNYTKGGSSKGIYITDNDITNGWRIVNVGFEEINYGLYTEIIGNDKYCEVELISPRMSENFDKAIKTIGGANIQLISENRYIRDEFFDFSEFTNGTILGKYCTNGYGFVSNVTRIYNGKCYPADNLVSFNWTLNNSYSVDLRTVQQYIKCFYLPVDEDFTITLNDYYGKNGVNEFYVKVDSGKSLTIKDSKEKEIVKISHLISGTVYHFYYIDESLNYYVAFIDGTNTNEKTLNNTEFTFENCSYQSNYNHNGYYKMGRIVTLHTRITPSSETCSISGFPPYEGSVTTVAVSCSVGNGTISPNGKLTLTNQTQDVEVMVSATYFALY